MARVILINLFLLLLPALLYFLYIFAVRWLRGSTGPVDTSPVIWLFGLGAVLMVTSLVYFTEYGREAGRGVYTPPQYRDGAVQPGRVEPPKPDR